MQTEKNVIHTQEDVSINVKKDIPVMRNSNAGKQKNVHNFHHLYYYMFNKTIKHVKKWIFLIVKNG